MYCGQTVERIQMKLGKQVGLGPGHIVLDGNPAPPPSKGDGAPQFSAHICCGQMAGWIKMPLGREVGLSPSDIVLDGTQLPSPKRGPSPQFSAHAYCGHTAGWMKMPLSKEVDLSPGHIVLDGDPAPHPAKGAQQPPSFRPMSIVATVAHLSYCWALVKVEVELKEAAE